MSANEAGQIRARVALELHTLDRLDFDEVRHVLNLASKERARALVAKGARYARERRELRIQSRITWPEVERATVPRGTNLKGGGE